LTTGTREVLTVIVNGVATARNGDFVPERARASTPLFFDDHIEIVSPRHGG
jgi:sulfur carrier protein